mgnify:CR=1 FL=1
MAVTAKTLLRSARRVLKENNSDHFWTNEELCARVNAGVMAFYFLPRAGVFRFDADGRVTNMSDTVGQTVSYRVRTPRKRTLVEWTKILSDLKTATSDNGLTVAGLLAVCEVVTAHRLHADDVVAFQAQMEDFAALVKRVGQ